MTLAIPVKILSDAGLGTWRLSAFHCRYSAVLFYITMYISIILLGLISLDRYLKIVRPFGKSALQQVRVAQVLSAVVWLVMLSLALPNVILTNQQPKFSGERLKCTSMKSDFGKHWHGGFNYFCQVPVAHLNAYSNLQCETTSTSIQIETWIFRLSLCLFWICLVTVDRKQS